MSVGRHRYRSIFQFKAFKLNKFRKLFHWSYYELRLYKNHKFFMVIGFYDFSIGILFFNYQLFFYFFFLVFQ
jgi:hypothetical protein